MQALKHVLEALVTWITQNPDFTIQQGSEDHEA
jgi:hypothetical protein